MKDILYGMFYIVLLTSFVFLSGMVVGAMARVFWWGVELTWRGR